MYMYCTPAVFRPTHLAVFPWFESLEGELAKALERFRPAPAVAASPLSTEAAAPPPPVGEMADD